MSLQELDRELMKWMREYDTLSNDYKTVSDEATRKREIYDLAKAHAMLKAPSDYTVDMKKAHVKQVCQNESFECHIAESSRDWHKERLRALAGLLNAAQSRANLVKEDIRLTNTPRY
jgi:lysyl-tRNA synthetase class I